MSAKWIWRGSDFELYLYHKVIKKRRQREDIIYPTWAVDRPEYQAIFRKNYNAARDFALRIFHTGEIVVSLNGKPWFCKRKNGAYLIPAGNGEITVYCLEENSFPTIYIDSEYLKTDESWTVLVNGNGFATASCSEAFAAAGKCPVDFCLPSVKVRAESRTVKGKGILFDFGRELVGTPVLSASKNTVFRVFYGESENESLDTENSEVCNFLRCEAGGTVSPAESKGFRYVFIANAGALKDFFVKEEKYIPPFKPRFISNDKLLNGIYKVAEYTLELTSREFFIDGIKRDRWVWAGDALQSEWFCFYSFFDKEIIKRSLRALIGSDTVTRNVNGILDYNFYFVLSVYYYYYYTGDVDFAKEIYPRLKSLMAFVFSKPHRNGLLQAKNEWIFIDWTDIKGFGEINNSCPICIIQILYWASLKVMAEFSEIVGDGCGAEYSDRAGNIKKGISVYFDAECGFYHDIYKKLLTKYGNIFSVILGFADEKQTYTVKNADYTLFQEIYTPYMKFYENCMYAETGDCGKVLKYMKDYWGGMIKDGVTTFWERYVPDEKGPEKYAMYGRKYGKSLCHSWGAGPLYLIGRYIVGLTPFEKGYEKYSLKPYLKEITFESELPVNGGSVVVKYDGKFLHVFSAEKDGVLFGNFFDRGLIYDEKIGGFLLKKGKSYTIRCEDGTNE